MKLREIVLKNFRGYYRETRIPVDDLTALIGKNDIGKSTILEALDIFFNQIKIDVGDRNVLHADEEANECDRINRRGDGSSARVTQKREMENYIHSQVVRELFNIQIDIDDTMDVSTEISNIIRAADPEGFSPQTVKKKLNRIGAAKMTLELLESRDPQGEVLGWLRQISEIIQ